LLRPAAVLPLVAVSSEECVEALARAGFAVRSRGERQARLERGPCVVWVREAAILTPEDLTALLRASGIPYSEFLDLLSDMPTS